MKSEDLIKLNKYLIAVLLIFVLACCEVALTDISLQKPMAERIPINDNQPNKIGLEAWELSRYSPVENKTLAIWSRRERLSTVALVKELHDFYGFTKLFISQHQEEIDTVLASGRFTYTDIMLQINNNSRPYQNVVNFPKVGAYYLDEPVYWGYSIDEMKTISEFVKSYSPNSKLITGDFHYRNTAFSNDGDTFSSMLQYWDICMFTSYKQWREFLGFWVSWPENLDQRGNWTDMQNLYGAKFSQAWIAAHLDQSEYYLLLEHANKLGLKQVWLYQLSEESNSSSNLQAFSEAAWKAGFLKKFLRKKIYTYIPILGEGSKTLDEIKAENRVIEIIDTDQEVEIKYNSNVYKIPSVQK